MIPIPIGTDRPLRRIPWMNILIILANVGLYFASHRMFESHTGRLSPSGLSPGWDSWMLVPTHPKLWQFFTYQFLHENLTHIGFNMLFLWVFGNNLNEKLGNIGYLCFYLTGGILAGCGQLLSSTAPTLGASGSISAVTGLFFVLLPRTHIRMFIFIIVYADVWEIPSMYFILFKVGQDVIEPLMGASNVAHMAHITGTVAGVVIGLLLVGLRLVQRDHYDLLAMIHRWRRRSQYHAMVAAGAQPFMGAMGEDINVGPAVATGPAHENPKVAALRDEIALRIREKDFSGAAAKYLEMRAIDPRQILTLSDQRDVANQLMAEGKHIEAAAAYEDYLRAYPGRPQEDQIILVLALIYATYVLRPERAKELLRGVLPRLHDPKEKAFAEGELGKLEASGTAPP